ncbi:ABC transporter ATP-binding protein [Cryptosporangium minutisporangium]|uniref:ABC transporter domain-containing protein n=1 Tax=Cryptosporangium minutisporangium TaxID=113569 RepID=A0ABP6SZ23_9ACTN
MPTERVVSFRNVTKTYEGSSGRVQALRGVDLDVERGEIFGLLGPNGAGKSTSIEILVGLRRPTSGTVDVLAMDPLADGPRLRERVSIQPQHASVFQQQTVAELLRTWASFYRAPRDPEQLLTDLGLRESRDMRVGKLSGGQQQRVLVGLALVGNPELLVLDEPSTGMDPNARADLWRLLREYRRNGGTVLLSTHAMEEAEQLCSRIAIMFGGRVVATGTPTELVHAHAPSRTLSFTVDSVTGLSRLDGIATVVDTEPAAGGATRVHVDSLDSDATIAMLAGTLGARDIDVRSGGLDGVFRRLTGHEYTVESPVLEGSMS